MACFELRADGAVLSLEPQVFALLAFLVEHRDRLVPKEELFEKLWDGRVVTDSALTSRIKSARQAIGDSGKAQRYIKTIHGKGFRFVGDVRVAQGESLVVTGGEGEKPDVSIETSPRPSIAVLPFRSHADSAPYNTLAEGLAHELITELARLRWLLVIARGSSFRFKDPDVDLREVGRLLGVSREMLYRMNMLGMVYRTVRQGLIDMAEMFRLIDTEAEVKDAPGAPALVVSRPSITFDNVVFGYENERTILHGLSFEVEAGSSVAIVGPSGSGKSTLGAILAGIDRPDTRFGAEIRDVSECFRESDFAIFRRIVQAGRKAPRTGGTDDGGRHRAGQPQDRRRTHARVLRGGAAAGGLRRRQRRRDHFSVSRTMRPFQPVWIEGRILSMTRENEVSPVGGTYTMSPGCSATSRACPVMTLRKSAVSTTWPW